MGAAPLSLSLDGYQQYFTGNRPGTFYIFISHVHSGGMAFLVAAWGFTLASLLMYIGIWGLTLEIFFTLMFFTLVFLGFSSSALCSLEYTLRWLYLL